MVFGTCCILLNNSLINMNAKSIQIEGVQRGFIVNFEITQTFTHSEKSAKEVHYVFPNDLKICIYDTTFVVGDEIIKPILQSKNEAQNTYNEAIKSGYTAVYGSNIDDGLTEFKLGNVQPETECKVILKIAFTGQLTKEKEFFIKFPLDIYNPSGSVGCLQASSFSFKLSAEKETIAKITSNIKNAEFNEEEKTFIIKDKVVNNDNEKSIILTFEYIENIQSSALLTPSNLPNYDGCALLISPNLPTTDQTNTEFVFVVDCSGSMCGTSIKRAGECLELFIRSLPENSYFNVIRFGSSFEKLFENSQLYDKENANAALELAQKLSSDLGGTEIYSPLENIFKTENINGQRQIFILTDGEVFDRERVLKLVSANSGKNRCFTIGIGRGSDAGLIEGIANASGGKCDFVQEGDSISEKVIPQLKSSLHPSLNSIEIHIEGENNDSFEVSPFPIPTINAKGASVVYLRMKKREENSFEKGVLITASYDKQNVEIPIHNIEHTQLVEEDKFGCSGGLNIGKAILPLFAFSILQKYEREEDTSDDDEKKAIELSIASGVLCKFTGFVGATLLPTNSFYGSLFNYSCKSSGRRTKQTARRSSGGRAPRRSLGAKAARKSTGAKNHDVLYSKKHVSSEETDDEEEENDFDLMKIIQYQNISGYWDNLEDVQKITGMTIDHIDEVDVNDENIEEKCISTILVVATIRVKSANKKNSWILIVQKAIDWLKKTLPNANIEKIISKIEKLVPN